MAGGNWSVQNKILPGVYTNYVGQGNQPAAAGSRGVVALAVVFPWLPEASPIALDGQSAAKRIVDYGSAAFPVREAIKEASKVYLYRLNKGAKATAVLGNLKAEAAYTGAYGNRLSVSIENAVGNAGKFHVVTWLDTREIDRQLAAGIDGLKDNDWVGFSASGDDKSLAVSAGTTLSGGTDGTPSNADHTAFLDAMALLEVNAVACMSTDPQIISLYAAWGKRMVAEEGKYLQVVVPDHAGDDSEIVISVKNGVYLEDGTHVPKELAAAYIAGATAGISLTSSLTNHAYPGAVDVDQRYTLTQQEDLARGGQLVFIPSPLPTGGVVVQKDINTLVNFTEKRTYAMSLNQVIRIFYDVAVELHNLGMAYIGQAGNSVESRGLYHAEVLRSFRRREGAGQIYGVDPADISVEAGELIDAMVVTYVIRPMSVVNTIYNTITVKG